MTVFQIFSVIFSGVGLMAAILTVYISMRIAIAKIEVQIKNLEKELTQRDISTLLYEKNNREDHKEILSEIKKLYHVTTK